MGAYQPQGNGRDTTGYRTGYNRVSYGIQQGIVRDTTGYRTGYNRVSYGIQQGIVRDTTGYRTGYNRVSYGILYSIRPKPSGFCFITFRLSFHNPDMIMHLFCYSDAKTDTRWGCQL